MLRSSVRGSARSSVRSTLGAGGGAALTPLEILQAKEVPFFLQDFVGRTDLTFQGTNTDTPADDASEAVALALGIDEIGTGTIAEALVGQSNLLGNPGFDTDTIWGKDGGATISGGVGVFSGGASERLRQSVLTIDRVVATTMTVVTLTSGTGPVFQLGTAIDAADGTPGAKSFASLVPGATLFGIRSNSSVATVDDATAKEVPGYHAAQAGSTSYRATRQADGSVKGDGLDDNLLQRLASSTSMFMAVAFLGGTNPASFGALIGGPIGTARGYLGRNSSGQLCAGVGTDSITTIVGGGDLSGLKGVAMLNIDATGNVDLEWMPKGGSLTNLYSAPINGAVAAGTALRLWATNASGAAGNFGADNMYLAAAIQTTLTPEERLSFATDWNERIPS